MTIIGLTGTIGAGKGTIVNYLEEKGFRHYSARSLIVAEIERQNMPINRDSMAIVANNLRFANSPSYIIEALHREAELAGQDAVIESIRTEGEIAALRGKKDFHLIAIDADQKTRYDRIFSRGNETDRIPFEKFLEDEQREMTSTDPTKQNIARCIELADYRIVNDGTIEELRMKVDDILKKIEMSGVKA